MEALSPLLQFSKIEMSEEEILDLRTIWFQFTREGDALFLRSFPGASWEDATLPPVETKLLKSGHADSLELLSIASLIRLSPFSKKHAGSDQGRA